MLWEYWQLEVELIERTHQLSVELTSCPAAWQDPDVSYGLYRQWLKGHLFLDAWARHSVTSDMWRLRKTFTYLLSWSLPLQPCSGTSRLFDTCRNMQSRWQLTACGCCLPHVLWCRLTAEGHAGSISCAIVICCNLQRLMIVPLVCCHCQPPTCLLWNVVARRWWYRHRVITVSADWCRSHSDINANEMVLCQFRWSATWNRWGRNGRNKTHVDNSYVAARKFLPVGAKCNLKALSVTSSLMHKVSFEA